MIILGIDPGTATTGYGLIRAQKNKKQKTKSKGSKNSSLITHNSSLELLDYGCIVTAKEQGMGERLVQLRKSLKRLLQSQKPDVVCIEEHFFGKNKKTAMTVSQARGVILEAAATSKAPIFEYQGFAIKHALAGERFADKKKVEKAVKRLLGLKKLDKPANGFLDDAVDGIAIAIYHAITHSTYYSRRTTC